MNRHQAGGAGVQVLGVVLLWLVLVGGLGLAEASRAIAVRAEATRALAAALQSASLVGLDRPAAVKQAFHQVLRANLGCSACYDADLLILQRGGYDPYTQHNFARPTLSAQIVIPYRLEYVGRWLPTLYLRVSHAEPVRKRKPSS